LVLGEIVCFCEGGPLEVSPPEGGPLEVGLPEIGELKLGLPEIGSLEIGKAQSWLSESSREDAFSV